MGAITGLVGSAAGGYASGMNNRRMLANAERQTLLQETELEMKKRGLLMDEQQLNMQQAAQQAQFGPITQQTAGAYGKSVGDEQFGAALTGMPQNQAQTALQQYGRTDASNDDLEAARIKSNGTTGDPNRDLKWATSTIIRIQNSINAVYGKMLPRDALDALLRDDADIGAIMKKHFNVFDQGLANSLQELQFAWRFRNKIAPAYGAPLDAPPGTARANPGGRPATSPATVNKTDPLGVR